MKGKKKNKSNVHECNHCDCEKKISEPKENDEDITTEEDEQIDEEVVENENKED